MIRRKFVALLSGLPFAKYLAASTAPIVLTHPVDVLTAIADAPTTAEAKAIYKEHLARYEAHPEAVFHPGKLSQEELTKRLEYGGVFMRKAWKYDQCGGTHYWTYAVGD